MRLHFPNTTRPKKAARHLASKLDVALSATQRAVAHACGYRDWHDRENHIASGPICALDQAQRIELFIERQVHLVLSIGRDLEVPDGDVQYALHDARLTGDRRPRLDEQIEIRLACWRKTILSIVESRQRGAVGKLKTAGRHGEIVILRQYSRPTEVISHQAVTTIADFEFVAPRIAPDLFLPMRLYLPYGYWTEASGARIVFSRDYKPLWRLTKGEPSERVDPWLRISFTEQTHLWEQAETPWHSPRLRVFLESFLSENGLHALPVLADALPLLVHESSQFNLKIAEGANLLFRERNELSGAA